MPKKVPCSNCHTEVNLLRISYGYPPQEEAAKRGEVVIGSCLLADDNPLYACGVCKTPLPDYGIQKDWQEAIKNENSLKSFKEKEKELLGKCDIENYLKEKGLTLSDFVQGKDVGCCQ